MVAHSHSGAERRRIARNKVSVPGTLIIRDPEDVRKESHPIAVAIRSLSLYGAGILFDQVWADGLHISATPSMTAVSPTVLCIAYPLGTPILKIQARVVWYDQAPKELGHKYWAGLEFTRIEAEDGPRFETILKELKKK